MQVRRRLTCFDQSDINWESLLFFSNLISYQKTENEWPQTAKANPIKKFALKKKLQACPYKENNYIYLSHDVRGGGDETVLGDPCLYIWGMFSTSAKNLDVSLLGCTTQLEMH